MAEWLRQGPAKPCTRVRFPLPPRAISSVGERFLDTEEVTGSIPVSPTRERPGQRLIPSPRSRSFVMISTIPKHRIMPDRRLALGGHPSRSRRDPTRRPCVYRPRVERPVVVADQAPELLTDLQVGPSVGSRASSPQ